MMRSILPSAKGWILIKTILVMVFTAAAVPEPPDQWTARGRCSNWTKLFSSQRPSESQILFRLRKVRLNT